MCKKQRVGTVLVLGASFIHSLGYMYSPAPPDRITDPPQDHSLTNRPLMTIMNGWRSKTPFCH